VVNEFRESLSLQDDESIKLDQEDIDRIFKTYDILYCRVFEESEGDDSALFERVSVVSI